MNRVLIALSTLLLVFGAAGSANALSVFFDFEGVLGTGVDTGDDDIISEYMSEVYGSPMIVDDAEIRDNDSDSSYPDWLGKVYYDDYLRVDVSSGDMELLFLETPITSVSGTGYVFLDDTDVGGDFSVWGYDSTYGELENPNASAEVGHQVWLTGGEVNVEIDFYLEFASPVTMLRFSDGGVHWVAVDNMTLTTVTTAPVPEPSTMLLLGAGLLGIAGVGRKRFFKK
ncbi:hypothetical protein D1BOALGB6SA_7074 [Olavius sp. associated proteobacterium Delta 1]|nr:hypothetical protein D1BOALGB6SA_7074 [Olavius sp. associated proteobacterium Delta 1]